MKKLLLLLILVCIKQVYAQNPTYQQKLFYTCKIWGFVKYFHSGVSTCSVNWDSVLVSRLPHIKSAVTNANFNDELDTLLTAAGATAIVAGVLPDTIPPELKRNRNFSWINDPIIRSDVKVILDTIKNNFRPHPSCWVQNNPKTNSYDGWLLFPFDSLMINSDSYTDFPTEYTRLLIAFKHWNILHYFNPYNYVLDTPSDSSLYNKILLIANATNPKEYYLAIKKMAKDLDDAHTEGSTGSEHMTLPTYYYSPPIILRYTQHKYIVAATTLSNIKRGDAIVSINGLTTKNMEDSLRLYISAGDSSVFHRFMCRYILNGYKNTDINIGYTDSVGNSNNLSTIRTDNIYTDWFYSYYPNDTLAKVPWEKFACNVGYVNMGKLRPADVNIMYRNLKTTSAIIFDVRNYPNRTDFEIANLMYPNKKMFSKFTMPDVTYPGTYYWYYNYLGNDGNLTPYDGKVIILMNEQTQSQAEFTCMVLSNMKNSVKVGSQTAGADGSITYFRLSQDIYTGFTNLGVYYPNGDSTQRIGIRPDTLVYPSPMGIRHHRDEVLEKALKIANCTIPVHDIDKLKATIYPNPTKELFFIETNSTETLTADLFDVNGRHLFSKNIIGYDITSIDVANLKKGVYFLTIKSTTSMINKKLVIIR